MSKIQVMNEDLANKIAAGEVVERCLNVVKELVENSIDAKSSKIRVSLKDSGILEITVADDGVGMDEDDAALAFSRHATSKLKSLNDLFHIASLGFRGEALPSIASVSKVELRTSTNDVGTYLYLEGGQLIKKERYPLEKGTTITVKNLFYNTPVRLKYLKSLSTELSLIIDYMNKMALSYPNIKFILENNDKELLNTTGDGNLLKVIYAVYGIDVAKKMIEINGENDDYVISGYVAYPEVAKASRNVMTTLVNGRVIKNQALNRAILDTYHTYIPKDKYPVIVINISVDPILVDINIHPQKMDIKFSKLDELLSLVTSLIEKKLKEILLIPHASVRNIETIYEVEDSLPLEKPKSIFDDDNDIKIEKEVEEVSFDFQADSEMVDNDEVPKEEYRIKKMHPLGIIHKTFIVAENEEGMYLIDQHAIAERINYEKFMKELSKENKDTTDLLVPIKLEYPKDEFLKIKEYLDVLKSIGVYLEEFGDHTFLVRRHPTFIYKGREKDSIEKIISILLEKGTFSKEKFIEKTATTLACRLSIKANDYISLEEADYLLETIRTCENPFTCPHGRPTIITYSNYELEKMFKRVMN
ncbi:dNA mismatch repair protein MutL [Clostridium sp. CAG:451]|nr:dNA mismatch repair protein MutL [Clostridium sp. CAG:451]